MSYDFNGSNQYLSASSPVTAAPITVSLFFLTRHSTNNQALIQIDNGVGSERLLLAANMGLAGKPLRAFVQTGSGTGSAESDYNGLTSNTIYHAAGVFASNSSRTAYLNGAAATTNTTTVNVGSLSGFTIASRRYSSTPALFLNGWIAEVGIWNAALADEEIASLSLGMPCNKIRPQNLQFYSPLIRDLIDTKRGLTITNNNGATVADHPRIYG